MTNIQEIDVQTLAGWQSTKKDVRLIDVRSESEFAQGMIPRGEKMPLHILPVRVNEIEQDTEIVFYCRSGARSAQACAYMASLGFSKVYNLRRGILGWAQQGFPIASPNDVAA